MEYQTIQTIKFIALEPTSLQILGLIIDILGAYYIVQGLIIKDECLLLKKVHGDHRGMSEDLFDIFFVQKVEARIGLFLLLLGFWLQGVSIVSFFSLKFLYVLIITVLIYFFVKILYKTQTTKKKRSVKKKKQY